MEKRALWVIAAAGIVCAAFCLVELWRDDGAAPVIRLMLLAGIASGLLLAAAPIMLWWQSRAGGGRG